MKRSLSALAVLGSFAGLASAQSSVTIFGIIDAAARNVTNESVGSVQSLVTGANNTGRFGVRGQEDLGGGLRASFWLESDLGVDSGQAGNENGFWNRRSTVSLSHVKWGEIRLGRDYTPTHHATCAFDAFNCVGVAGIYTLRAAQTSVLAAGTGLGASAPLTRANNSIHYYSPVVGGFMLQAMVAAGEGQRTGAVENSKLYGLRVGYAQGPVDVRVATIHLKNTVLAGSPTFKDVAAGALYNFGVVSVGVHYRQQKVNAEKLGIATVNAQLPIEAHNFKVQLQRMNQSGARAANDASMIGLGYEYNLSKRTALYASFGQVDNDGTGTIVISGGPAVTAANFGGKKSTGYEAGLRHNF